jgi:hypothetical protein
LLNQIRPQKFTSAPLRKIANDTPQVWLSNEPCRGGRRVPGRSPLVLLRPTLVLALHFQREDMHLAIDNDAPPEKLLIGERADWPSPDHTHDPGFLERFARCRLTGRPTFLRPALWYDPTPRFARCDEHDFRSRMSAHSIGQSRVLNAFSCRQLPRSSHQPLRDAINFTLPSAQQLSQRIGGGKAS